MYNVVRMENFVRHKRKDFTYMEVIFEKINHRHIFQKNYCIFYECVI